MFRDESSRAFAIGALAFGIPCSLSFAFSDWYFDSSMPWTTERILSCTLYFLFGGLVGMVLYFIRGRRIRFSVSTLLLIMFMLSLFATAAVMARDRHRNEMRAVTALQGSLGSGVSWGSEGWNYLPHTVVAVHIYDGTIAPEEVSYVVDELNQLPNLKRMYLGRVTISDKDLTFLKAALPHVEFQE